MPIHNAINLIIMNKYISIGLGMIIGWSTFLQAQDYQTVRSDRTYHYTYSDYYDTGRYLSFDSLTAGTDSIFFPFMNIWEDDQCYIPFDGSWIGKKVIIGNNGYDIFLNMNDDSVKIKRNAELNESWVAFQLPGIKTVIAEIVKKDTLTFLGLTDSVKTIRFEVFDGAMNPLAHPIDSMSLLLSKHYGLVRSMNFYLFPDSSRRLYLEGDMAFGELEMTGITSPDRGVQHLTIFDVHDYQPGDEFHVIDFVSNTYSGNPSTYINTTKSRYHYLERKDFLPDSIVYRVLVRRRRINVRNGNSSTGYEEFITKTVIEPDPEFDRPAGAPVGSYNIFPYISDLNGTTKERVREDEELAEYVPGCWADVTFSGCISRMTYRKGLGGPYHYCEHSIDCCFKSYRKLVYYKKDGEEEGTPFTDVGIDEQHSGKLVTYPNPVSDLLYIQMKGLENKTGWRLSVIDAMGRIAYQENIPGQAGPVVPVNLSQLATGVYLLKLHNQYELWTDRIIVKK